MKALCNPYTSDTRTKFYLKWLETMCAMPTCAYFIPKCAHEEMRRLENIFGGRGGESPWTEH